jgi:iron-sulfur cluster assembly protein
VQPCAFGLSQSPPPDGGRARPGAGGTIRCVEIAERPDTLVTLTPVAADKIRQLMAEDPDGETSVLRVAIQGGGCSGFQYGLGFDAGPVEDDETLEQHGVTIVIDPYSAPYLKGATIDFLNGLQESGFKIDNPNAAASCGCGHSFTVADESGAGDAPEGAPHAGGCGSGCSH